MENVKNCHVWWPVCVNIGNLGPKHWTSLEFWVTKNGNHAQEGLETWQKWVARTDDPPATICRGNMRKITTATPLNHACVHGLYHPFRANLGVISRDFQHKPCFSPRLNQRPPATPGQPAAGRQGKHSEKWAWLLKSGKWMVAGDSNWLSDRWLGFFGFVFK